jgi:hypothetical protein
MSISVVLEPGEDTRLCDVCQFGTRLCAARLLIPEIITRLSFPNASFMHPVDILQKLPTWSTMIGRYLQGVINW